jgi:hypothetical protein
LQYDAPHYVNPNAGSPGTAAVTPAEVLPPLELGAAPPRLKRPKPKLRGVRLRPRRVRSERLTLVGVRITLARGAGDRLSLVLERRAGGRYRRVLRMKRRVSDGATLVNLVLRRPRPGSYRLKVKGSRGKARVAKLRVVGRRTARRR